MNKHHILLIIYLICATIWVGGHLFLVFRIVPKALRENDISILKNFKQRFEPLGMPSLILLLITGILIGYQYDVKILSWFSFSNAIEKVVSIKLILFGCTFLLAMLAEFLFFPKLSPANIKKVAVLIILVTLIALTMLVLGTFVRYGGLY